MNAVTVYNISIYVYYNKYHINTYTHTYIYLEEFFNNIIVCLLNIVYYSS